MKPKFDNYDDCDNESIYSDTNNNCDIDLADKMIHQQYLNELETFMYSISKLKYGEEINFCFQELIRCNVRKNIRFDSYIFRGRGCKNILKQYMGSRYNRNDRFKFNGVVQLLDSGGYRQFILIRSWNDFWDCYKDEMIIHRKLFEVILSDRPCKPYLDIEWEISKLKKTKKEFELVSQSFVDKITKDLVKIFADRYGYRIDEGDLMITTAHKPNKLSFHVVINHFVGDNILVYRTNRRGSDESAWDLYIALIELDEKYYQNKLDQSVYSLDREFRIIYSNKHREFRPFVPIGSTCRQDQLVRKGVAYCLSHVATYYNPDKIILIKTPENNNIKYYKSYNNQSFEPIFCSDKKANQYINLVRGIHPTAYFTGESNGKYRFSYQNKNELCYTGNRHDSNGFYIMEDEHIILMKCLSENCKKSYILKRKNLFLAKK